MSLPIAPQQLESIRIFQGTLQPSTQTLPETLWPLLDKAKGQLAKSTLSVGEVKQLLVAELIYLQHYTAATTGPEPSPWATRYLATAARQIRKTTSDAEAGQSLYRSIERLSRMTTSDKLVDTILGLLKTAYARSSTASAVGAGAIEIISNFKTHPAFTKEAQEAAYAAAFWAAYGEQWAKDYQKMYGELAPGLRTVEAEQIRQGYIYLAEQLTGSGGFKKTQVAELLGVSRFTVNGWLKG